MKRNHLFCLILILFSALEMHAQKITRVEPMNWWVGMKTPLQILMYGKDLAGSDVRVVEPGGVKVKQVHQADNPDYLFIDVDIAPDATPGTYTFELKKGKKRVAVNYEIAKRRNGSAQRKSFDASDLIYLIMPDRFANGNPGNDMVKGMSESADRSNLHGRHGGDIQGIANGLDYMRNLGVTALWSTPLLLDNEPTYSYHGYACGDYYQIDPRYGTNLEYRELVKKAHEKGIKMIMDVVPNHCGIAHWWMKNLPFKDWINTFDTFTQTNHAFSTYCDPNASQADMKLCETGWFDKPMPDMKTENPFVLHYFKQAFVWWVEWADLDGLRVDTYPYNEPIAMADWTKSMLAEYPNLNIVGECMTTIPSQVAYWDGSTKNKNGFTSNLPSVMDFPLQEAVTRALSDKGTAWGEGLIRVYQVLAQDFVYSDPRKLLIFADNHDSDRLADMLKGDPAKVKLALTMIATMRGVSQLYYGTELMFRSKDMTQGHGGARVDFPGGWSSDNINLLTDADRSPEQRDVFNYASKLFNWRKGASVIHKGNTKHYISRDNTYSYVRYTDKEAVLVFVNAGKDSKSIDWKRYQEVIGQYTDGENVITGRNIANGEAIEVAGESSVIIAFKYEQERV